MTKDTTTIDTTMVVDSSNDSSNSLKFTGDGFDYQCNDNFKFLKDGFRNIQPVSDSINLGINNLKMFFDKNPNHKLVITGYATSEEKNTSAYPNLGFARANDVKNYFVSKGFSPSQFDTTGELKEVWKSYNDTLLGPIGYKIIAVSGADKKEDWNAIKAKINANPLVLYFNTGQAEINLTPEERQKVADLVNYLDNVSSSKLSTVGHTDNAGNRDTNIKLGLNRANFAKDYLSKNGVSSDRIEASSKGPDEPITDNSSTEGKAKNRRTVVTIK
jgi:outer membrane protein OmpA-like peptidoglycan-associated protein